MVLHSRLRSSCSLVDNRFDFEMSETPYATSDRLQSSSTQQHTPEIVRGMQLDDKYTLNTPPQGRTFAVVGDIYRFLVTGKETNGSYAQWEAIVPPGGGPPPHIHSREEEGFYVLEGEITFTVEGKRLVAKAGTFANMPPGTQHSFKNESQRPARMLITVAPAGLEQMFFESGVPLPEGSSSTTPPTMEEIEKLLAIAPNYGIRISPPSH